jgi:hypothetical protein
MNFVFRSCRFSWGSVSFFMGEYDQQRLRLLDTKPRDNRIVEDQYEISG